jgi:hypothetical protein
MKSINVLHSKLHGPNYEIENYENGILSKINFVQT